MPNKIYYDLKIKGTEMTLTDGSLIYDMWLTDGFSHIKIECDSEKDFDELSRKLQESLEKHATGMKVVTE